MPAFIRSIIASITSPSSQTQTTSSHHSKPSHDDSSIGTCLAMIPNPATMGLFAITAQQRSFWQ